MSKLDLKKATINQLVKELASYGITIYQKMILIQYANSYNIKQVENTLIHQYDSQIRQADEKTQTYLKKCLFDLLDKIIKEAYPDQELIDPYYLKETMSQDLTLEQSFNLVDSLIRLNQLHHADSYVSYFDEHIGEKLIDALDMSYKGLSTEIIKKQIHSLQTLIEEYSKDQEINVEIEKMILERIAYIGNEDDITMGISRVKQKYYISPYAIYTPVLIGLVARNDHKLVDVYYNKAKQYMISTKEDDMYSDLLDKIYEEYKK